MSITSVTSTNSTTQTNTVNLQDFLNILLTQLTYQDPMKPMDNQQFMAQIAQFTTLEQTQQLNDKTTTLITNQAAMQSVGFIGRSVDVTTASGTVTGTVKALSLSGTDPQLTIQTTTGTTLSNITLSQVTAVR